MARVTNTPTVLFVPSWMSKQLGGDNYQDFRILHALLKAVVDQNGNLTVADEEVAKTMMSKISKYDAEYLARLNQNLPTDILGIDHGRWYKDKNQGIDPNKNDNISRWDIGYIFNAGGSISRLDGITSEDLYNSLVKNIGNSMSEVISTDTYEIIVNDIGITVILHIGFGNAIVTNDLETIAGVYHDIVNNMFKYFGEASYTSPYFGGCMNFRLNVNK